jgi:hypothetical protein
MLIWILKVHKHKTMMSSFFRPALILMVLVTGVAAHSHHDHHSDHGHHEHHEHHEQRRLQERACGTGSDDEVAAQAAFDEWLALHGCTEDSCSFAEDAVQESIIQIDVVWHDILKDDGTEGSTSTMIYDAIDVLNGAFAGGGFSFSLVSTTVTQNTSFWEAVAGSDEEAAMKSQLRTGDCSTLNIYSTGQAAYLGWATFPTYCGFDTIYDGVVINYQTSPGGTFAPYDKGDTLTHGACEARSSVKCCLSRVLISSLKVTCSKR